MAAAPSGGLKRDSSPIIKVLAVSLIGVVVFGYAAACGYLWAVQPRLIFRPRAEIIETPATYGLFYIVEAAFISMRAMADTRPQYRIFPIDLILNQDFNSISKVGRIRIPVLYLHGTDDRLVPPSMSQQLFERTLAPKRLVFIDGGGHNNSGRVGGKLYLDAVSSFAAFRLQPSSSSSPLEPYRFARIGASA